MTWSKYLDKQVNTCLHMIERMFKFRLIPDGGEVNISINKEILCLHMIDKLNSVNTRWHEVNITINKENV